jgi:hypothetical protein
VWDQSIYLCGPELEMTPEPDGADAFKMLDEMYF